MRSFRRGTPEARVARSLGLLDVFLVTVSALALGSVVACDSDGGGKAGIGVACASGGQCASGICAQSVCIDPAACVEALGADAQGGLVVPCVQGISELTLSPDPATPNANGYVQFTLTGTFASDTGDTVAAPEADGGSVALTGTTDLTATAEFTVNTDLVMFEQGTPGLASVEPGTIGQFTVTARIQRGNYTKHATAQLVIPPRRR